MTSKKELSAQYGHYGEKLDKALKLVSKGSVKLHKFLPSGREIWTVVGREGDQLVDDSQPYCSCGHFYYQVLSNKDDICYHLLGLKVAKKTKEFDLIEFQDSEYPSLLESILKDIAKPLRKAKNTENIK
ncbi:MAG: SWIM zinc finger family protein [Candidatus Methylarchaceae archaeon HK01B]|nr:SWIM zinc finger family protein [Candidatus Methylarchaceae archaeon HK01M]MCP8312098.1 SWIM zinc finger family protein [Candidatus Methylarchaceae archaeon HK02M1]MCP8319002.1 SWIM zinc finger family protein [Candidatus Methylarchaceae archaeon HK01B]